MNEEKTLGAAPRRRYRMILDAAAALKARARRPAATTAEEPADPWSSRALSAWERGVVEEARPYTMTSPERILATMDAALYALRRDIDGAFVECGVWRGGSVLAMIRALQHLGVADRDLYLFDTFEGMTPPTEKDTSPFDAPALETWRSSKKAGTVPWRWAFDPDVFNLESVRSLVLATGYPAERIHFVQGRVEDTIPRAAPESIAVLRLDTDWYDSTWHELVHLYPRLPPGGVLLVDDYGHWDGCRAAVDRYFGEIDEPIFLARIDYTGRVGVKVHSEGTSRLAE
jgi:O-methyltransferase